MLQPIHPARRALGERLALLDDLAEEDEARHDEDVGHCLGLSSAARRRDIAAKAPPTTRVPNFPFWLSSSKSSAPLVIPTVAHEAAGSGAPGTRHEAPFRVQYEKVPQCDATLKIVPQPTPPSHDVPPPTCVVPNNSVCVSFHARPPEGGPPSLALAC